MIERFQFYIRHSINDLRVNRQRTFFALLCIAAGVAAIVSLQTLAVMIQSNLTGNLQANNKGDIQFEAEGSFGGDEELVQQGVDSGVLIEESTNGFGFGGSFYVLDLDGLSQVETWLMENAPGETTLTYRQPLSNFVAVLFGNGTGASLTSVDTGDQVSQTSAIVVDTDVYPFYEEVNTVSGETLSEVMNEATDIVIVEAIARQLDLEIGDHVVISGAEMDFTVRGIVEASEEVSGFSNFSAALGSGFYYLDHSALELFPDVAPRADAAYVRLDETADIEAVANAMRAEFPYLDINTTNDLGDTYSEISENVNQLVTIMGLLSLLIGGIGIVNTMQVIVRRRTVEIAVLKTLGLQGNQVTALFLVEAFIMGILGSIIGVVIGLLAVFIIRGAAETLLAAELAFVVAPQPILTGVLVGVLVTTVFGFLPTLTAGEVRPGIVLRPNDAMLPRSGLLRSLFALLIVIVALSFIALPVLGDFGTAFAVMFGAFVAAGLIYLVLSFLIWIFGRFFPTFGAVDLKVALRQMLAARRRGAITLLALVIGVFSLSTITLFADSIQNLLRFTLEEATQANINIVVPAEAQLTAVEEVLSTSDGVNSYRVNKTYQFELVSVQDGETGEIWDRDVLAERLENAQVFPFGGPPDDADFEYIEILDSQLGNIGSLPLERLPETDFDAGRQLESNDAGNPVVVITEDPFITGAGISAGDTINYTAQVGGVLGLGGRTEEYSFEVIGLQSQGTFSTGLDVQQVYTLEESIPEELSPAGIFILADVEDSAVSDVRRELSGILGVFVVETSALVDFINRLLNTFIAFPTMVAALGLIVGGVVIANSVALTTLERRREIAVMKAVGLQRERVLFMLLLENGVLGFIGGLIGVGIGFVALAILFSTTGAGSAIPYGTGFFLMVLCIGVALLAAMTTAWGASGEKPLNVLRYE